jgi:hypothetical protein
VESGNWIALGGVSVALISYAVTYRLGNRRLRFDAAQAERRLEHERRLEDRRVAGEILDEAVETLRVVELNLVPVRAILRRNPELFLYRSAGKSAFEELESALPRITHMLDRIRFRFGAGSIALNFERCYESSAGVVVHLAEIAREEFVQIDEAETKNESLAYCRKQVDEAVDAANRFGQSFEDFRGDAYEVIGIRP